MSQKSFEDKIPSLNMLVDTVDKRDVVTGLSPRHDVLSSKDGFRVVHVFIFDKDGYLLLQKTSDKNIRHPHHWGSSVAGYLFSGESYLEAAYRRTKQEIGISAYDLENVGIFEMPDGKGLKHIGLFTFENRSAITELDDSIEEVRYFPVNAIRDSINEKSMLFTPTFEFLFDVYLKSLK